MSCFFGHKWNGCKCEKCGKARDEGHAWEGCKCVKCGKTRDVGHTWEGNVCKTCGETSSARLKPYTGSELCFFCQQPLEGVEAYHVLVLESKKYRNKMINDNVKNGIDRNSIESAYEVLRKAGTGMYKSVCVHCLHEVE